MSLRAFTCVLEDKVSEEEGCVCVCGLLSFQLPWKHTIKSSTNSDNHSICILESRLSVEN